MDKVGSHATREKSRRLIWLVGFLALMSSAPLGAQVVECPGSLPATMAEPSRREAFAAHQFNRFVAALDLVGVDAFDQTAVLRRYSPHPEQLLAKLHYLSLQCQLIALEQGTTFEDRRALVRNAFLDYAITPPSTDAIDLALYVNQIAARGGAKQRPRPEVRHIEKAIAILPRRDWQRRWFNTETVATETLGSETVGSETGHWAVIVASPRYEQDGWTALQQHQVRWPDVYFELHGPFDVESPHFAIIAGRRLGEGPARALLQKVRKMGMAQDAYVWQTPAASKRLSAIVAR